MVSHFVVLLSFDFFSLFLAFIICLLWLSNQPSFWKLYTVQYIEKKTLKWNTYWRKCYARMEKRKTIFRYQSDKFMNKKFFVSISPMQKNKCKQVFIPFEMLILDSILFQICSCFPILCIVSLHLISIFRFFPFFIEISNSVFQRLQRYAIFPSTRNCAIFVFTRLIIWIILEIKEKYWNNMLTR